MNEDYGFVTNMNSFFVTVRSIIIHSNNNHNILDRSPVIYDFSAILFIMIVHYHGISQFNRLFP